LLKEVEMTPRNSKVTRQKIIDKARKLFFSKGYQDTSVNAIIEELSISKGAFYHHFSSKEELLDALVDVVAKETAADMEQIISEKVNAVKKMNNFFAFSRRYKTENIKFVKFLTNMLYRQSNGILLEKLLRAQWIKCTPFLEGILKQGKKEGLFDFDHETETADILYDLVTGMSRVNAMYIIKEKVNEENREKITRLNASYERAIERLVGAKTGSFKLLEKGFVDTFRG
jgi:AcrR family transcriptional regulator